MDVPTSKSIWTPDRVLAGFGVISVAVSGLLTNLEALENPKARWIAWGITAMLFALAAFKCTDERAEFLQDGSIKKQRALYFLGATTFLAVLVCDVATILWRVPFKYSGMNNFVGMDAGYTSSDSKNPLVVHDVKNVARTLAKVDPYNASPFFGLSTDLLLQKKKGIDFLLLHDCRVVVEQFEEMPPYLVWAGGVGEVESIKAAFTLERKEDQLPWSFSPTDVAINDDEAELPILIDDFAPARLTYYVHARTPGIYWVKCYAVVSDGIGSKKEVCLTAKSIPLAFYEDRIEEFGINELDALKSDEWIPFPVVSKEARAERLRMQEEMDATPFQHLVPAPAADEVPAAPAAPDAPAAN